MQDIPPPVANPPTNQGQDSYYPPPPLNQQVPAVGKPQSLNGLPVGSGEVYTFAGPKMYVTVAGGKPKPVPDGIYPIPNSHSYLIVQNGRRQLASN